MTGSSGLKFAQPQLEPVYDYLSTRTLDITYQTNTIGYYPPISGRKVQVQEIIQDHHTTQQKQHCQALESTRRAHRQDESDHTRRRHTDGESKNRRMVCVLQNRSKFTCVPTAGQPAMAQDIPLGKKEALQEKFCLGGAAILHTRRQEQTRQSQRGNPDAEVAQKHTGQTTRHATQRSESV